MERNNSLTLKARSWMNPNDYANEIATYGLEWPKGVECTNDKSCCSDDGRSYQVIWAQWYDMNLIELAILNPDPAIILCNFKAYIDDVINKIEIEITENNYLDYIEKIHFWYLQRKGKYDPTIET